MTDYPRISDEFPDFDLSTLPAIPADWEEDSWHNDACPSFTAHDGKLKIYVDYDTPELREFPELAFRYSVSSYNDAGDILTHLETNDWPAVLAFVESWQEPCTTGHHDNGRGVCGDCGLILTDSKYV